VMTKGLPTASFKDFRNNLCVNSIDAHTEGVLVTMFARSLAHVRTFLGSP
jgi:hypothetical protein